MEKPVKTHAPVAENEFAVSAQDSSVQNTKTGRWSVRGIAFKGLVVLLSLFLIASFNVVFLMIVISWLPDATYLSIIPDQGPADLVHRVHDSILPVTAWVALIGTVIQLHRPQEKQAPLLMALAIPALIALVELATGTYTLAGTGPVLFGFVLLAVLHPRARDLLRIRHLDKFMTALTAVAAVVWIRFAIAQAQLQRLAVPGDTHAAMEHWNRMAAFALFVVMWALIGATDRPGWRLTAWVVGLASIWYGLQSLLFPSSASTATVPWALAALVWAIGYLFATERRARSIASQDR